MNLFKISILFTIFAANCFASGNELSLSDNSYLDIAPEEVGTTKVLCRGPADSNNYSQFLFLVSPTHAIFGTAPAATDIPKTYSVCNLSFYDWTCVLGPAVKTENPLVKTLGVFFFDKVFKQPNSRFLTRMGPGQSNVSEIDLFGWFSFGKESDKWIGTLKVYSPKQGHKSSMFECEVLRAPHQ